MKFKLTEAEKLTMEQLIQSARDKGVQYKDLFSGYTYICDPIRFLTLLTADKQPSYRENAYKRIKLNRPYDPFYRALEAYVSDRPVPKLEPAIIDKNNKPTDGRHRAAFCDLLNIKLPIKREE